MEEKRPRILIMDDEMELGLMVRDYLQAVGFDTVHACSGSEALRMARESSWDLLVLDIMMPGIDGLDVARRIRARGAVPIIFLTAKAEESDRILGFELGGDDYLTKPFSLKELAARIRAILRRSAPSESPAKGGEAAGEEEIVRGRVRLDPLTMKVSRSGVPVELTPGQFMVLKHLMSYPERVFSRGELLLQVSGDASEVYERTIDVHIKNIRKALEPEPSKPRYLETVHGVGYRFTLPAEETDD
jgi:DNA-binding response OmpR family regulator